MQRDPQHASYQFFMAELVPAKFIGWQPSHYSRKQSPLQYSPWRKYAIEYVTCEMSVAQYRPGQRSGQSTLISVTVVIAGSSRVWHPSFGIPRQEGIARQEHKNWKERMIVIERMNEWKIVLYCIELCNEYGYDKYREKLMLRPRVSASIKEITTAYSTQMCLAIPI
jgi:hypothetical protein